jgi:hypothetical protein
VCARFGERRCLVSDSILKVLYALDVEAKVSVLVAGAWIDGEVVSIDSDVLLLMLPGSLVSIDMKSVAAVKSKYPA